MMLRFLRPFRVLPHLTAAALALWYAWQVSQTPLNTTGVQFVSPVLVIFAVHLAWLCLTGGLRPGFSVRLYRASSVTALGIVISLILGSVFAPQPAMAAGADDVVTVVLMVVVCSAMIALVVLLVVAAIRILAALIRLLFWGTGQDKEGPDSRLFDFGSVGVAVVLIGAASLEGMPGGFAFSGDDRATASHFVAAPPEAVWEAMGTATTPEFPLPVLLALFPQPVAVTTDEGVALGANRVVMFQGREGAGALRLQVIERTDHVAAFAVLSDTTPYAGWIAYQRLTYRVDPVAGGTVVSVTLDYERKLAPAWFFGPAMKGAAFLAVDVLARDVTARAEQ